MTANSAERSGVGAITAAVRRASGECFPLQHFCPESGGWGIAGADSWQPEWEAPVVSLAIASIAGLIVQALCNMSAVIATNRANFSLSRNVFPGFTVQRLTVQAKAEYSFYRIDS
jgi:hypothetical protein